MAPNETVEHTAANLSSAQHDYAAAYEAEAEGNHVRVSTILPSGVATLHLHSVDDEPRDVVLDKNGNEVEDKGE